jgi:hypothetical protein
MTTPMGVGAHVEVGKTSRVGEKVGNAVDRYALVISSLAASLFAVSTSPALTARRQFKRGVVGDRWKKVVGGRVGG